ncbi:MAG: prephenate dehydratase domain-containing protein [Candidatus Bathyarchaeia archaeon]
MRPELRDEELTFETVLTLGPEKSWSDIAVDRYLRERPWGREAQVQRLVPVDRSEGIIRELSEAYRAGRFQVAGFVPIYNTLEGRVKDTLSPQRGLLRYRNVKIRDEYVVEVSHCLAAKPGHTAIAKVISHPQALGQCSDYIRTLGAQVVEAESTAQAARLVAMSESRDVAAICPEEAARWLGLEILEKRVENRREGNSENKTVFVLLGPRDWPTPTGRDKTTLTCELLGAETPGVLSKALRLFGDSGMNLSKIESMEKGSLTEYVFWLNVDEHRQRMQSQLEQLAKLTKWHVIHGSYPRAFP